METKTIKEQLRQFTYYIIIAAISLLTIIVFPLIGSGSSISIEQCFPTTQVGWIIYIIERVLVIVMNLTIFTSFIHCRFRQISPVDCKTAEEFYDFLQS